MEAGNTIQQSKPTFNIAGRDLIYLIGFLVGAAILLFLGRGLVQGSALATWGLTFGATTAVAVLLVSLYRVQLELQASRRQLARKEAELSFALEVQRALFPRQLPRVDGLEFAAVCIPASGISGDYYDVMQFADGRLVFAIADISGKGISAAILMANVQALLRTLAETGSSPSDVCKRLNHHLHQVTDASKFATFFYGEWDGANRRLRYVNAGHNTPIVLGSLSGRELNEGGVPLGMFPCSEFQTAEATLEPEDLLVLYSDGITEARSSSDEEFGEKRLQALIEKHSNESLADVQAGVLEAVSNWAGDEPEDDMTLLMVRATGPKEDS
ncbi:MAG TPA: PP2C family protein-serine/threonine phosphatase [Blastocatellia bacterium]|nr:PP2C family protein-serine/threonine phosphatase [Blastocatellia bacterium]